MVKLHVNKSIHETDTDRKSVSLSYGMVNFYFGVVHIYIYGFFFSAGPNF